MRQNAAREMDLPDALYDPVVFLKNPTIRKVVIEYLDFQGDRVFRHLMRKYDLYEALCDQQIKDIFDDEGQVNSKSMVETSKQIDILLADIRTLEEEMRDEYAFVFDNFKKIREEHPGTVTSLSIEGNKYVK